MKETKMKKKIRELIPTIMFQDIETTTGPGIPDVIYGAGHVQGWIEYKQLDKVPKTKFKMPWRPGQLAWHARYRRQYKIRQPYFVMLTIKNDWYLIDTIKEDYTMEETKKNYICQTKELKEHTHKIANILLNNL